MKRKCLPVSTIDNFEKLYKEGKSTHLIAKRFGISHSTVIYHLHKKDVKLRTKKEAVKLALKTGRLKVRKHNIPRSSKKLTPEKAYIIGVLCGDGWIWYSKKHKSYQIGLEATDEEFVEEFKRCLTKVFKKKLTKRKIKRKRKEWQNKYRVKLCSKMACEDLISYGSTFKKDTWIVPKEIKISPMNIQARFLMGFFDSEGSVDIDYNRILATSSNLSGLREVGLLLKNFGLRYKIIPKSNRSVFSLRIQDRISVEKFQRNIGFIIERKKRRVDVLVNKYKVFQTPPENVKVLESVMFNLRERGLTCPEIAEKLDLGVSTVWKHLKDNDRL